MPSCATCLRKIWPRAPPIALSPRSPSAAFREANADVAEPRSCRAADADGSGPGRHSGRLRRTGAGRSRARQRVRSPSHPCSLPPPRPCRRRQGWQPCRGAQDRAGAADIGRHSNPAARRHPRLVRTDEAGPGEAGRVRPDRSSWPRPLRTSRPQRSLMRSRRRATCRRHPAPWWPKLKPTRLKATSPDPTCQLQAAKNQIFRTEMPPQPANHGTGNEILGVLPASNAPPARHAGDGLCGAGAPGPAADRSAERRHEPRAPTPAGSLGRRPRKRKRGTGAHRSRPRPGQGPARQGRAVHRAGSRQGRAEAVPGPLRRPRPRSGRGGVQDPEALRHFLHHRSELIPKKLTRRSVRNLGTTRRHFRITPANPRPENFSSRFCS